MLLNRLEQLEEERVRLINEMDEDVLAQMKKYKIGYQTVADRTGMNLSMIHRTLHGKRTMKVKVKEFYGAIYGAISSVKEDMEVE